MFIRPKKQVESDRNLVLYSDETKKTAGWFNAVLRHQQGGATVHAHLAVSQGSTMHDELDFARHASYRQIPCRAETA